MRHGTAAVRTPVRWRGQVAVHGARRWRYDVLARRGTIADRRLVRYVPLRARRAGSRLAHSGHVPAGLWASVADATGARRGGRRRRCDGRNLA